MLSARHIGEEAEGAALSLPLAHGPVFEAFYAYVVVDEPAVHLMPLHFLPVSSRERVDEGSLQDLAVAAKLEYARNRWLDELADLWSDSPAESLPGALWRLYLLRSWVHGHAGTVSREYATGRKYAEVHAVVAGVADPPGPDEVRDLVDAVLRGVAAGDFATTLDRAAAFARIVATGRAHLADDGHEQVRSASRLVELADQLQAAARAERAGQLW